jgi:hypothetical protein
MCCMRVSISLVADHCRSRLRLRGDVRRGNFVCVRTWCPVVIHQIPRLQKLCITVFPPLVCICVLNNGAPSSQTRCDASKTSCSKRKRNSQKAEPQKKQKQRQQRGRGDAKRNTKYDTYSRSRTDTQYSTAAVALTRTPHAHAIQSLREHACTHIVSSHR